MYFQIAGWVVLALSIGIRARSESPRPTVVAHRGASAYAPENTLAAFNLAWSLGADAAEGDFHLTADGEIVCCHDKTTERTAGRRLVIAESTLTSLRSLDVGSWKHERFRCERIVTLGDVLATVPADKGFFIELKCGTEIVLPLVDALTTSQLPSDRVRVIAFDKEVIRAVKRALPRHEAYWLSSLRREENGAWEPSPDELIATALEVGADGLDLKGVPEVIDAAFVRRCHVAGLSVHAWTIDDDEVADSLATAGVSSITTNRPDTIRAAITTAIRFRASDAAEVTP
ncbi:putative glycerophosphoryl diester phosphodiesterase 1 [Planctomycetes bacterium MalM25]|nr:putative glycerophosphoryl diester phosphodiesterase 1 [Planctomycetes bacterium MalM25]